MDWHPIQGGVEIFLVASCHGTRDKLRPDGPLGSCADFTLLWLPCCPVKTLCDETLKAKSITLVSSLILALPSLRTDGTQ